MREGERGCLCSHVQKQLSVGWNSGYSACFSASDIFIYVPLMGPAPRENTFCSPASHRCQAWSLNATWIEFIVYPIPLPVGEFVLLLYNKGQILPALLNNSGARWALFCLISGTLCLFVCLCECAARTGDEATCLPCLKCEETSVCTLRGVCLCVCVYSRGFLRTSCLRQPDRRQLCIQRPMTRSPARDIASNAGERRDSCRFQKCEQESQRAA